MSVIGVTPVLLVERIEPVVALWEGGLGLTRTAMVEHEGRMGFVMYAGEGWSLMYQTWASALADIGAESDAARQALENMRGDRQAVFVKVSDIAEVEARLAGLPLVMPRRTTFYGATEIAIQDPAGHLITFAEFKEG
jgi:catechol 2,3-dioxygenase-like lactoylglutathione lyase family enzyme